MKIAGEAKSGQSRERRFYQFLTSDDTCVHVNLAEALTH